MFRILREGGPGHLARFAGERLGSYRSFRRWVRSLPPEMAIEPLVEVVVKRTLGEGQPVYAWQKEAEILALLERLKSLQPRRVLEIGTAAGGTLFLLSRVAAPDALLVSIDMPEGGFGGGYNLLRSGLYRSFAQRGQRIVLIRGDSHRQAMRRRLATALDGERLDFLFIDGDHSEAGSRQDFEDYAPFVRPGGLIAFHDIRPDEKGWSGEVYRVWPELAARFDGEELVDESGPSGYGIGLLRWPGREMKSKS
ncbi:MAG TPA: class I SAM-dependent methyltransferase [Thermoanaerobaculia bacterium]|nr:class I SAM-dependent methyltransferase [Thermoanaerobaculia bacterium]